MIVETESIEPTQARAVHGGYDAKKIGYYFEHDSDRPSDMKSYCLDVYEQYASFYVLEDLSLRLDRYMRADLARVGIRNVNHHRWYGRRADLWVTKDSLRHTRADFNDTLGRLIHDYLMLACWGEAQYQEWVESPSSQSGCGGYSNLLNVTRFHPIHTIPQLEYIFNELPWKGSFGGKPWGKIASALRLYYTAPVEVFIDHCVDLEHHGGLAFDKGYIINALKYSNMDINNLLEAKKTGSVLDLYEGPLPLRSKVLDLYENLSKSGLVRPRSNVFKAPKSATEVRVAWGVEKWELHVDEHVKANKGKGSEFCSSDCNRCAKLNIFDQQPRRIKR